MRGLPIHTFSNEFNEDLPGRVINHRLAEYNKKLDSDLIDITLEWRDHMGQLRTSKCTITSSQLKIAIK